MILLVGRHSVETYWGKTTQLGGVKVWVGTGLEAEQMAYIPDYKTVGAKKAHNDPYFERWLAEYYHDRGMIIENEHPLWFYGIPQNKAAYLGVMRYWKPVAPPMSEPILQAKEWVIKKFAFMGNSRVDYNLQHIISLLNMSSSPGYPYIRAQGSTPAFATKRAMFQYAEGEYALREYKRYLKEISKKDYFPITFHTLTPKCELRKKNKIDEGNFRVYVAANVCNTCAGLAIFGEMNEKLYSSWRTSPSFVGGSTFNGAWNILFKRLSRHPHAFECDESNWDNTLHASLIWHLRDIMWTFLCQDDQSEVNYTRMTNLFKDIIDSLIICPNGDLLRKVQGNPSGCFLTIVINTLVLYMIFCYAWITLCPYQTTFEEFDQNVELALCGDDNLGTYATKVSSWFNTYAVAEVWRVVLGINAKAESQAEGKLDERQFLSHRTVKVFNMYLPYPDHDKVVSSLLRHSHADKHIRWSFVKAAALRISSFWNIKTRGLIDGYLKDLMRINMDLLQAPQDPTNSMDIFTWEQVYAVYKTDKQIISMYTTDEGSNVRKKNTHLKRLLRLLLSENAEENTEKIIQEIEEGRKEEKGLHWTSDVPNASDCDGEIHWPVATEF